MKTMKTRASTLLLAISLLVLMLISGGCDTDKQTAKVDSEPVIGVLLYKKDDTYVNLVNEALQAALAGKATVITYEADSDQITQIDQFERLVEQKVNAIVVNVVDTQAGPIIVDMAKKADIPVIFFNREPDLNSIKAYAKASFVGTTAAVAGKMQGEIIKKIWDAHPEYERNKDGNLQYVMLQGTPDNPEALARTEFSVRVAREKGVPMQQLGETYVANWDEKLAYQAMQRALAAHGNAIELVIANNDAMALGAIAALAEHGYNKEGGDKSQYIPVVGVDATPRAVEAIQKGIMSATVKQDGAAMGEAIAALTLNAVQGKDFLQDTEYMWDESGTAIRIPYSFYSME